MQTDFTKPVLPLQKIGLKPNKQNLYVPNDQAAFVAAAEKFARRMISASVDAVLYSVELDPQTGKVHTQLKEKAKLTAEEKSWLKKQASAKPSRSVTRQQMVKSAQMMGGEMGGQGGAAQAPGAGASLPAPPAGGQPPAAPPMGDYGNAARRGRNGGRR
jgi:hypothetical protein